MPRSRPPRHCGASDREERRRHAPIARILLGALLLPAVLPAITATSRAQERLMTPDETSTIESSDIPYAEAQVEADPLKAYRNYRSRIDVVALERANLGLARRNFDLAQERYKVEVLIPLELREAQNAPVAAESRLVSARYDAELAGTGLLRLSGRPAR